ncbi:uncharacterized protein CANTADRAFT_87347 [Suhomyces tanzawaensis NRRL Y-17324]|uniref:EamA domain-containing protein n=1 Tax=Suhomyces tanzawaensis NRRL Y-17324 TaxID=984487 RepID=A0A1E4SPC7_9ASCO|nr:uncharacterized protein CANTADRAFT_87347 [Suhomyces tanzawaensis NRRL Y-17324]ODV81338.1 hypothetical protein CANTADRAFT_87347 [Suhomyces tanzawaensis NRRL Y-17324]
MAITILPNASETASVTSIYNASRTKIIFVTLAFVISLVSFVSQTEITSQAYQLGFSEPVVLLLVTHGSWWVFWPIQAFVVSVYKTYAKFTSPTNREFTISNNIGSGMHAQRMSTHLLEEENDVRQQIVPTQKVNYWKYFKKCIVKQFHNVYHTSILIYEANVNGDTSTSHLNQLIDQNPHISNTSSITACVRTFLATPAIRYILWKSFLITLVLTVAGSTWYGAMSMTYAADVTAIYNCSAFTAYAFAIPILHERFSWLKMSSVIIAISGVFIVAYSDAGSDEDTEYPYRFWGNLIIFAGAILYGYYEVLYKRYLCIPPHLTKLITPRRQMTFANFVMGLLGFYTFLILFILIVLADVLGIHKFNLIHYGENTRVIWSCISGSIISNIIFSASFLSLMALTSPVLSSVSSLVTIFLIGLVEWWLFGNSLSFQQLLGDMFVIVGFVLLTVASWKEISEGNDNDDVDAISTYSFALSYDG